MKLIGIIKLAHQTIARAPVFFGVNLLVILLIKITAIALLYLSLQSGATMVMAMVFPLLGFLLFIYLVAAQAKYFRPRIRGEELLPTIKEPFCLSPKNWLFLSLFAVLPLAGILALKKFLPGLTPGGFQSSVNPLTLNNLVMMITQSVSLFLLKHPLLTLVISIAAVLLVYIILPLFAWSFAAAYQKEEGLKAALRKIKTHLFSKPCSSTLLYLFSMVIIILLPLRLMKLTLGQNLPAGVDLLVLGVQWLLIFVIATYGVLMALVSQMALQEVALKEKEKVE